MRKVAPIFASRVAKAFAQSQMHYSGSVKCRVPATCPACPSHPPVDQHLTTCHDQIEQSQHQYPYSLADACRTPRSNVEPVQGKPMLFRKTLNGTGNLRCVSNIDGHGTASGCHVTPLRRCRWRDSEHRARGRSAPASCAPAPPVRQALIDWPLLWRYGVEINGYVTPQSGSRSATTKRPTRRP